MDTLRAAEMYGLSRALDLDSLTNGKLSFRRFVQLVVSSEMFLPQIYQI